VSGRLCAPSLEICIAAADHGAIGRSSLTQSIKVENGIHLEVIWFDQDVIEIVLSCSNGRFSGLAEIYLSHDDLPEFADGLRGFPRNVSDSRTFELGSFNPNHADGGIRLKFSCPDSTGRAVVEIRLRGDACEALGEPESVALRVPVEPAGIDSFVQQLTTVYTTIGAGAVLPMAI
jgi:hypothetical protein